MSNIEAKQRELIDDLWTVYYGNPLYDEDGGERDETYEQVFARALISIMTSIQLAYNCEVPK